MLKKLLSLLCLVLISTRSTSVLWRKVFVDTNVVLNTVKILDEVGSLSSARIFSEMTAECSKVSWCNSVCYTNIGEIRLLQMMVSPYYINKTEGFSCFTRLEKDLVFGKTITGMTDQINFPGRKPLNLAKGIYSGDYDQCAQYEELGIHNWILVDFGKKVEVTKIILTPITEFEPLMPNQLEIKIGNTIQTTSDFSSYKMFKMFTDSVSPGVTYEVKPTYSKLGRYLSIKELGGYLTICYLQVF